MRPFPWGAAIIGGLIVMVLPFVLAALSMEVQAMHG